MSRPLVILRPEPGASATARRAADLGLIAVVAPLFAVRPLDWSLPTEAPDALLLTSANAARHGGEQLAQLRHLPVHAVGPATAAAARAAGLRVVSTGDAGVAAGVVTAQAMGHRHVLHLAGRDRTALSAPGMTVLDVYVSAELPAPGLPPAGVALLHSARAARRFAGLVDPSAYRLVAISEPVLRAAGPGWRVAASAERPDDAAMLALAAAMCESAR